MRGTSRTEAGCDAIEAAEIEAALADPDRVGTVLDLVGDVSVVVWPLGSADGAAEAVATLHGSRLERLLEGLVDTPVRGFVYDASGSAPVAVLEEGAGIVRAAHERWRIPVAVVAPPASATWEGAMAAAVRDVISRP